MNAPILSQSVAEFWGMRWNMAFRDLTHRYLFRPLTRRFGPQAALAIGFVVSGIVHDIVISIPAKGGYGWPTLYFLIQGAAILVEKSRIGKSLRLGRGWIGRIYAGLVLVGPAFLLFHRPFVVEVVVPFLDAIRLGG